MTDETSFKPLINMEISGDGSASVSFPLPERLKPSRTSMENKHKAIDYYILARYSFFHHMHDAYMVNTFWAIEHLILAILCFRYKDKNSLKMLGFHRLTKYWKEAKTLTDEENASNMERFENFIGNVQGFYNERYPTTNQNTKFAYTSPKARVVLGNNPNAKANNFDKSYKLDLDKLDHFVNFMVHDIISFNDSDHTMLYLMDYLDMHNNTELYLKKNKYSIIIPERKYNGERK
ncbi:hypothetical protein P8629_09265 [Hydrogenovibrio sp. 3SP14C1]|uniref:hypothetical protein n=1 Tax=Hydrogenovibrio sp. 3SP14C1 TaxID=3038774 RepID=UPI002416D77F|nr:hypothetical protein [Hydrogenovibrio sp. 3SP14C1]MDG4813192.1 hypothetical protein [Hydrogenovibrio sp. 3SP14C1]